MNECVCRILAVSQTYRRAYDEKEGWKHRFITWCALVRRCCAARPLMSYVAVTFNTYRVVIFGVIWCIVVMAMSVCCYLPSNVITVEVAAIDAATPLTVGGGETIFFQCAEGVNKHFSEIFQRSNSIYCNREILWYFAWKQSMTSSCSCSKVGHLPLRGDGRYPLRIVTNPVSLEASAKQIIQIIVTWTVDR